MPSAPDFVPGQAGPLPSTALCAGAPELVLGDLPRFRLGGVIRCQEPVIIGICNTGGKIQRTSSKAYPISPAWSPTARGQQATAKGPAFARAEEIIPQRRSRRQFLSFPRQRRGLAPTGAKSRMVVAGLEREGVCGRSGSLKNAPPPWPSPPRLRGRSRGHPCRRLAQVLRVFPAIQRDSAGPWRCSLPEDSRGRRSNWHRRESPKKHTHARFTRSDLPSSETLVIHFPGHGTLVTLRG
jgi:hypothetical protein